MKALLQNFSEGGPYLENVPIPSVTAGKVVIKNECSLVSTGTEMMLVNFGESTLVGKALKQPERVKEVLRKVQVDGLLTTVDAVKSKLNSPIPLGYSCTGRVVDVAPDVKHLKIGDRVVANGQHAEYCVVASNLTARVPDTFTHNRLHLLLWARLRWKAFVLQNLLSAKLLSLLVLD